MALVTENFSLNPSVSDGGSGVSCVRTDIGSVGNPDNFAVISKEDISCKTFIAEGGFGTVYKAKYIDGQTVAVKMLKDVAQVPIREKRMLIKEAEKLHALRSPHIIRLLGVITDPGHYSLVLEYMKHGSLHDLFCFDISWALKESILQDVICAMDFLHHGRRDAVLHLDLKSRNVLMASDFSAKVSDFGLSKWKLAATKYSKLSTTLDPTKNAVGTVTHIPPESWRDINREPDRAYDRYGFGILVWEVLTQESPFSNAHQILQISDAVQKGQRPDLKIIHNDAPDFLQDMMKDSWNQDPEQRPSFRDLKKVMEENLPENFQDLKKEAIDELSKQTKENENLHTHPAEPDNLQQNDLQIDAAGNNNATPAANYVPQYVHTNSMAPKEASVPRLVQEQSNNRPHAVVEKQAVTTPNYAETNSNLPIVRNTTGNIRGQVPTRIPDTVSNTVSEVPNELSNDANSNQTNSIAAGGQDIQYSATIHNEPRPHQGARPKTTFPEGKTANGGGDKKSEKKIPVSGVGAEPFVPGTEESMNYNTANDPSIMVDAAREAQNSRFYGQETSNINGPTTAAGSNKGRDSKSKLPEGVPNDPSKGTSFTHRHRGGGTTIIHNIGNVSAVQIGDKNVMYIGDTSHAPGTRNQGTKIVTLEVTESKRMVIESDIQIVCNNLGKHWKRLGRQLNIKEGQLDIIEHDNRYNGLYSIIHTVITTWRNKLADEATVAKLADALCDIGKVDVAHLLPD